MPGLARLSEGMPGEKRASEAATERRDRKATAEKLVLAAAAEFNAHGYGGTDTNRIARRAGFAPQTFYRWFADKTEIFIKVYDLWQQEERDFLRVLYRENAGEEQLVQAAVAHHRAYLIFRRSLRQLSLENERVRAARAESRLRQLAQIAKWQGAASRSMSELAAILLQLERLSDALAEGEFADMGLDAAAGEAALAALIRQLRAAPAPEPAPKS
jgi:AcrR family transcriptional regulator